MSMKVFESTLIAFFALMCMQVEAHTTVETALVNLRRQIEDCMGRFICGIKQTTTTSTVECIDADKVCDGIPQCKHGTDEHNCPRGCEGLVVCPDGQTCAKPCDGKATCADGEDEQNCATKCPADQFLCSDRIRCSTACNGIPECRGGDDEILCPPPCRRDQTLCADGRRCNTPCDGFAECPKDGDERNCPFECRCQPGQYRCQTAQKCVDRNDVCEGRRDTPSGSCLNDRELGDDEANSALGFQC